MMIPSRLQAAMGEPDGDREIAQNILGAREEGGAFERHRCAEIVEIYRRLEGQLPTSEILDLIVAGINIGDGSDHHPERARDHAPHAPERWGGVWRALAITALAAVSWAIVVTVMWWPIWRGISW